MLNNSYFFLKIFYSIAAFTGFGTCLGNTQGRPLRQAQDKPNILFIFADDQSYETVHAHGNEAISTPHLDTLAESGVSFYNAYNMGGWNGAICVASRTMMQTGRFIWRAYRVDSRPKLKELAEKGKPGRSSWSRQVMKLT